MSSQTLERPVRTETAAEYFYDYAGQDPINGYDLDGTMNGPAGGLYTMKDQAFMCGAFHVGCPGTAFTLGIRDWRKATVGGLMVVTGPARLQWGTSPMPRVSQGQKGPRRWRATTARGCLR